MREIVESYFKHRSLVNHQLASYNDCIPIGDGKESRMENIVRNIRIGSDEPVEDDEGGLVKLDLLDKEIIVRDSKEGEEFEALDNKKYKFNKF